MGINRDIPDAAWVDELAWRANATESLVGLLGLYGDSIPVAPMLVWLQHVLSVGNHQLSNEDLRLRSQLARPADLDALCSDVSQGTRRRLQDLLYELKLCDAPASGATDQEIQRFERHLVAVHMGAKHRPWLESKGPGLLRLPALLVDCQERNDANVGLVCWLVLARLSAADYPEVLDLRPHHGALLRLPGAYLLGSNAAFDQALQSVQAVLQRALAPLQPDQPAQLIAWSLIPAESSQQTGRMLESVNDESLGGWLTLASLHLMADSLTQPLRQRWGGPLHEMDLGRMCATVALGELPPLGDSLLQTRLKPVGGATHKLAGLARAQGAPGMGSIDEVVIHEEQVVEGNHPVAWKRVATLEDLLKQAHALAGSTLTPELQALQDALLDLPLFDPDGQRPRQAPPRHLLQAALRAELPMPAADASASGPLRAALKASLLQRYAHWASGRYQPFGVGQGHSGLEPVLLADHFYPIDIHPIEDERRDDGVAAQEGPVSGLHDLLHKRHPEEGRWVLTAAPAGGKTTLLAAFELNTAHAALQSHQHSGRFGIVALWLPLREFGTSSATDSPATLAALWKLACRRYPLWAPALREAAQNRQWKTLTDLGLRVVWLLDGVNELPADSVTHRAQVVEWIESELAALSAQAPQHFGQRVFTVRTHNREGMLPAVREATLVPWDDARRRAYMVLRLGAGHPHLMRLQESIDADPEGDDRKLMATAGHLATQINLLESGLTTEPAASRAELFCTLLWVRLHQEVIQRQNIPRELLSRAEQRKLANLSTELAKPEGWRWPKRLQARTLVATLARLAVSQQHLDPNARRRRREGEQDRWAMTATLDAFVQPPELPDVVLDTGADPNRSEHLLQAAEHLNVLVPDSAEGLVWTHQLHLELFAALALSPDAQDGVWLDLVLEEPADMETLWQGYLVRRSMNGKDARSDQFKIPVIRLPDEFETARYLVQLRGKANVIALVERLLINQVPQPELAARIAVENIAAFGERRQRLLDTWRPAAAERPDRSVDDSGTHPTLNRLRKTLCDQLSNKALHISRRLACAGFLDELGGDPRFAVCGEALILKDQYWQRIGGPDGMLTVHMGNPRGDFEDEGTFDGQLVEASVEAFEVSGLLVTGRQYLCFGFSEEHDSSKWWSAEGFDWLVKNREMQPVSRRADTLPRRRRGGFGSRPAEKCNFYQAEAYARWESAQRRASGSPESAHDVVLMTEARWEAAARSKAPPGERWHFVHCLGIGHGSGQVLDDCVDARPWHFNDQPYFDGDFGGCPPVGVFVESSIDAIQDMGTTAFEWTRSEYQGPIRRDLVDGDAASGQKRVVRGSGCISGRSGVAPGVQGWSDLSGDNYYGLVFRLMRKPRSG